MTAITRITPDIRASGGLPRAHRAYDRERVVGRRFGFSTRARWTAAAQNARYRTFTQGLHEAAQIGTSGASDGSTVLERGCWRLCAGCYERVCAWLYCCSTSLGIRPLAGTAIPCSVAQARITLGCAWWSWLSETTWCDSVYGDGSIADPRQPHGRRSSIDPALWIARRGSFSIGRFRASPRSIRAVRSRRPRIHRGRRPTLPRLLSPLPALRMLRRQYRQRAQSHAGDGNMAVLGARRSSGNGLLIVQPARVVWLTSLTCPSGLRVLQRIAVEMQQPGDVSSQHASATGHIRLGSRATQPAASHHAAARDH
jgi:hypothetical protein